METYFLIYHTGKVYRKDINVISSASIWQQLSMKLAAGSDLIIKLTENGEGYSIKNRYKENPQIFSKDDMIMLSLQAENV
jgi:hypothetical protein